ncbi:MAG: ABC transporter substrate-binding protein [Clostridia bacterium]|nr:ABC transporter substrate-binding protein [Clostridia bacterium]
MKKNILIFALIAALAAVFAAPAGLAEGGGTTFVYARADSVTSFDLHREITSNNAFAIDKVFEPLVMFDAEGLIGDYLAASHTISEDGLVYTFTLRDGLKFSDGADVTAEDVKFSLERHLAVEGPLPLEADIASIEAADEKTVVITLNAAYTPFFSELANFSNGILPKDFGGKTEEEFFKNPVGTGPFVVSEWDPAGDLVFVKNEYYWQEGRPAVDRLVYKVISDDNQAINQLRVGDVDAVESLSYANAAEIAGGPETYIIASGSWNVEELFFNTLDEHFSDVHARRALALALDREALARALTFGYGEAADAVLPAALRYSAAGAVAALTPDLEAAKAELAQSAFPEGFSTTLSIPSGNNVRLQEALIVQAAGAAIGIDIRLNVQEIAAFRQDFRNLNYSIMINVAVADFPDADSIFAFQVDPEGFSNCFWTSYRSDEAVALMKAGQVTPDGGERAEIYEELQRILAADAPYVPLYYPSILVGARADVEGLAVLPNGTADFTGVVKK